MKRMISWILTACMVISLWPASLAEAPAEVDQTEAAVAAEAPVQDESAPIVAEPATESIETAETIPADEPMTAEETEPSEEVITEELPAEPESEPEVDRPEEQVYPWPGMEDVPFATYIRSEENTAALKAILADQSSAIYVALMTRLTQIEDTSLRQELEEFLQAIILTTDTTEELAEEISLETILEEFADESEEDESNIQFSDAIHEETVTFADTDCIEDSEGHIEELTKKTAGTCGENLVWTLDNQGTLTVSGTGEMANYSTTGSPWYNYRGLITKVEVYDGVTNIGDCAFYKCNSLTQVRIPSSVQKIGWYGFYECSSLTSITIPVGVTRINWGAFGGCSSLVSVVIPSTVTSIESFAFSDCTNLTTVEIPSSITTISDHVFFQCVKLTSCSIPSGVTSIGEGAFAYCYKLSSLAIPNTVTSIGSSAFQGCTSLIELEIPTSVTSLDKQAFYGCSGLTSIIISSSLRTIPNLAFANCSNLKSAVIPSNVTRIGESAFNGCSSIITIEIPLSVKNIGDFAFRGCDNLSDIYYEGTLADWDDIVIGTRNEALNNATLHCSIDTAKLQAFVTRLYSICLGRSPGASELNYYVSQLVTQSTTGIIVASNFVFSGEFKAQNLCDEHYIRALYQVFFNRQPGADEVSYHAGRLSSGAKREDVFNGFALSPEYAQLCSGYGIAQGTAIGVPAIGTTPTGHCTVSGCTSPMPLTRPQTFVVRMFSVILNREPTEQELTSLGSRLTSGSLTGAQAVWEVLTGEACTQLDLGNRAYVTTLYQVLLSRDPSTAELSTQTDRLLYTSGRKAVFDTLAASQEFASICSSYSVR